MTEKPTVALLGLGLMGTGMARNVLAAGLPLRVWNRTRAKAEPLAEAGAEVADSPAAAVEGADVLVTMLYDADSVAETITAAAPALTGSQVWAQTSTVGVDGAAALAELAGTHRLTYVDAPVLGNAVAAEQGQLTILAAGPPSTRDTLAPVFDAVGRRTTWVADDAASGAGSRLKLALNSWVLAVTGATAEAVALTQALGVDPRALLDAVDGGPLDLPYLRVKSKAILDGDWAPTFTVDNAGKDVRLITAAGEAAGARMLITSAVGERLRRASELGHGDEDMVANYFASFPDGRPPA